MKVETDNLIRISTYARRAEKSIQWVHNQIKTGKIEAVSIEGMHFVINKGGKNAGN